MDQNSGNTTDKRNWRERLGIGKTAAPGDLPKLSDDFKPATAASEAPKPTTSSPAIKPGMAKPAPHAPIKAAPMAPRPAARPAAAPAPAAAAAKPAAPRVAPISPDGLASKLKDQRDAAERLAVQRVQAAKQRAETQVQATIPGAKPKFTFADEEQNAQAARAAAIPAAATLSGPRPAATQPMPPRPAALPPQAPFVPPQTYQPQIQPPRPQLGASPNYPAPPGHQQAGHGFTPPPAYQPQYQPPYGQQPSQYRPIDPATGYVPPQGFNPAAGPGFSAQPQGSNPRLTNPTSRPPLAGDRQRLSTPRGPQLGTPQMPMGPSFGSDADGDDVFEAPQIRTPRRATANEYQQAYRDELGYEDELPRSRGLGMILGLLLLGVLVAIGVIYGYSHFVKNGKTAANGGTVPVVTAPAGATKITSDTNAAGSDLAGKKQIYDRIEGDHEIAGAAMKTNEEAPTPPAGSGSAQPAQNGAAQPATGGGDGTPLPLPPPPGGGTGQQGALSPDGKTDMANITPAAEPASAANSSGATADSSQSPAPLAISPVSSAPAGAAAEAPAPPVPGATKAAEPAAPKEEVVIASAKPAVAEKTVAAKPKSDPMKKLVLGNSTVKNLGAKPVVLVPPSGPVLSNGAATTASSTAPGAATMAPATGTGGGLYGDTPVVAAQPTSPLKVASAKPLPTPAAPSPAPATGAYVVQLASFNSKAEAQAEYARLGAKHGAIITRYAPIIDAGTIAGTTRYRLNLGPMASSDVASSVCSALISAGERDCKVGRQ
jgi:hypothetical protein